MNVKEIIDNPTVYRIQEFDPIIKFRSLNRDHNFIFISNKNSIQVLEPIKLIHIYSFHHNETIIDFVVSPKDSSLILCSSSSIEIYQLICAKLSDYHLKIKYELKKSLPIENICNLSVSTIGDVIACISRHRGIKLFDNNLNLIKTLNFQVEFLPHESSMFPLDVFQITYDTKNIILSKYNTHKISLIYKCTNFDSMAEDGSVREYAEKIIPFNEKIIYLKEYQKSLSMYMSYQDSSVFFVLTTGFNFLIMRKTYEKDPTTYDLVPNLVILLYIDLSPNTTNETFPYLSFSLLYDNENPIFKGEKIVLDNFQSGIVNMEQWQNSQNKNTLSQEEINTFLNYNEYYLKTISSDYILFNFAEGLIMYKIDGLQSPPFNNPSVSYDKKVITNKSCEKTFVLLKVTKTLDRKYSIFFVDKYYNMRKFTIKEDDELSQNSQIDSLGFAVDNYESSDIEIADSRRVFTIFRNIVYAEYNNKNRKTVIYERLGNDSLLVFFNSKLEFSKTVVIKSKQIHNLHWIKDSNFIIFTYITDNNEHAIGIIYVYSKYFENKINIISHDTIKDKFILLIPNKVFKDTSYKEILHLFMESPYAVNNIVDKKAIKENIGYNDVSTDLLIKTDCSLLYCSILISNNNEENSEIEFKASYTLKWQFDKQNYSDKENWDKKEFIFNNELIFYFEFDPEYKLFNICEIDNEGDKKIIFQTVIFKNLLYAKMFFNTYLIFITNNYINTYDVINRTFYRVRNDYVTENGEYNIDLFKSGIYICLTFLSSKDIRLVRIPRNKNSNENFSYELVYSFDISKTFSKIIIENNMIIFNETQLENLSLISNIKHNLLFKATQQELLLLNSNANSLFDCETFLDFFLSDNEEIIKLILNIFCDLYNNIKDSFNGAHKNSKLIPNLLDVNSIDYIIQIIFENDLNVLSMIGNEEYSQRKRSMSSHGDKPSLKINMRDPQLKFKMEEDDQEKNPINVWCSKSSNLLHLKYIYDLISSEDTRNVDNFTKYFILKIKSKYKEIQDSRFKMSSADLCWVSLINNQEDILKFICKEKVSSMTWEIMTMFNIPIWIKSDIKLKELLEHVGRNEYKRLLRDIMKVNEDKTQEKNFTEHVALYFYLADKQKLLEEYYDREPHNVKIKKFIQRDFSIAKNRKIAKENADTLMNKKKYLYAAYFYLLADDIRSALDMTLEKLGDINLTICLLRLVDSKYGNDTWKKYYSLDKVYQDFFINFGTVIRDPWLVIYGYLGQKKIDLALEYVLNYDIEFTFEKNKEIFDNIEDYKSNLEIVRKIFGINVFDYKILLFAKSLEKLYLTKLSETKNEVKTVENTNFEDLWDMDGDDDEPASTTTQVVAPSDSGVKQIDIDYKNLTTLCLVNSLKRGVLYAPIINLYKLHHGNSFSELPPSLREILKNLICDRVVIDTIYSPKKLIEKFFKQVDNLFTYLENNKLITKIECYTQVNNGFLLLDKYDSVHISCTKSQKLRDTLIWLTNFTERLMNKNLYILENFNFYENVNLEKVNLIVTQLNSVSFFLKKICEFASSADLGESKKQEVVLKTEFYKNELNLYIFRIIFMIYFYLLFSAKITMKYNMITELFKIIEQLGKEYKQLDTFKDSKVLFHLDKITEFCFEISTHIKGNEKIVCDESLSFYIQFLNLSINKQIEKFLGNNDELKIKHLSLNENKEGESDHYFHEEFKFVPLLKSLTNSYKNNFEANMEKYIKNYMDVNLIYKIHNELKTIYMKDISQETNYFKYEFIPIKNIFPKEDALKNFESKFQLKEIIITYISHLCKQFKYERKTQEEEDNEIIDSDNKDNTTPNSHYNKTSISIVNQIFNTGYEVALFNESTIVQGFAINPCDISNIAVSTVSLGHRKINMLYNILVRSRSENLYKLTEPEPENWEEVYKKSFNHHYINLSKEYIRDRYNEIIPIIYHDIVKAKKKKEKFPMQCYLPPEIFNEIPSNDYLDDISLNDINSSSYCKVIQSHPQLPLYLTSNNKGVLSLWSYNYSSKKSLDEFYVERITKENAQKVIHNITRLKFSPYGNDFLACNQEGNLYLWGFDHYRATKLPKLSLLKQEWSYTKDAAFLNNSGVLVSTSNKSIERHKTTLWDLLLPQKKCNVGDINVGGNFVLPISSSASFAVINDKPGMVSFVDIRRMEVVKSFQAHSEEIKAVKISAKENFMVTFGNDSYVKIWDMTNKTEPLLVEAFQPFPVAKSDKKSRFNLEIADGFLFASKDNVIKMLRNKII